MRAADAADRGRHRAQAFLRHQYLRACVAYRPQRLATHRSKPEGSTLAAASRPNPDYLKINPKGRVPALVTKRGGLTEKAGHSRLYPLVLSRRGLGAARRSVRLRRIAFNAYLCATPCVSRDAHRVRDSPMGGRPGCLGGDEEESQSWSEPALRSSKARCCGAFGSWAKPIQIADPDLFTLVRGMEAPRPSRRCSTIATGWRSARPSGRSDARGWRSPLQPTRRRGFNQRPNSPK